MSWLGRFVRALVVHLPGGRRLNAELQQARRQRDLLLARLKRAKTQRAALRRRLHARRQRARATQPDPVVLEQVMASRHAAAVLVARRPESCAREAAFAARSSSYRELLTDGDTSAADAAVQCVTIAGLTWRLPARPDAVDGLAQRLLGRRRLPLDEILQTRELAIGRVMIDIGANIGTTSIPRAVLGDFGCVYAIEPDPLNYKCLVSNIAANQMRGLVFPDCAAIGDINGVVMMRRMTSGTHHLVQRAEDIKEEERVAVPSFTLDSWIERIGIDLSEVGFIKSDTQGWDARVLAGAEGVLAHRHISWQIEFSPAMLERSGTSPDDVIARLERHFTHFIDLRNDESARVRRTRDLAGALRDLESGRRRYTNLILYSSG